MTIANVVTIARIGLVPVFLVYMGMDWRVAALVIFSVAAATDFIDGYLARRMGQVTNFGKIMDPLADKLLVLVALICFIREGTAPVWVVAVVLAREFLVSALRIVAASEGKVLAADFSGKVKTVVQIFGAIAILTPWYNIELWPSFALHTLASWLIAAVTVWSGLDYLVRHRALFKTMKQR
ncbi:MAG: CDP-diacylglycerol--glycerol-3-phosphate 3-phosphatidyltransferase [Oscillospiraceae bacterium]|jgi:CDP-diacylglycerol--glycerol-3-phosphate 3-phosphatidyltransferase|nr:CDP-diacylglycerol--glycerol-3-phosphate 3-phosphatidyltransferase [Oscillospiraceae bacterium]